MKAWDEYKPRICFECGAQVKEPYVMKAGDNMRGFKPMCLDCFEPGKIWFNEPVYSRHWNYRDRQKGDVT